MTEGIAIELITVAGLVVVALIQAWQARAVKRESERSEAFRRSQQDAERRREERDEAMYTLLFADATGTEVLLHKAHGDDVNGNVDAALSDIRQAKADLNAIRNEAMARL